MPTRRGRMLMRRAAVLFGLSERQMDQHGGSAAYQNADSALKDGLMELSPTAAHISHSGVQLTAPQVSTRSGEHHTVR